MVAQKEKQKQKQNQNYPAVIIVGQSSALNPAAGDETTTTMMINDTSSPLVLNDGDNNCGRGEHKHDDYSVSITSDITFWRESDGDDYLGDLAEIHDPGYYELSLKPEQSPMVSCIQDDEPNSNSKARGVIMVMVITQMQQQNLNTSTR